VSFFGYTFGISLPSGRHTEERMRGRKSKVVVLLTTQERTQLEHWRRSTTTPMGLARRAIMVLAVADAHTFTDAAKSAGLTEKHGRKWVNRFLTQRLEGLSDKPGRGRKPAFPPRGDPAHRQNRL
jgi:hypothetical protein